MQYCHICGKKTDNQRPFVNKGGAVYFCEFHGQSVENYIRSLRRRYSEQKRIKNIEGVY